MGMQISTLKRGTAAPNFHPVYCGRTAGWIEMPLGAEVGLDPGDIVLDGDPDLPRKGTPQPPHFCCLRTQAYLRPSCVGLRTQDRCRRPVRKPRPMSIAARRLYMYGSSLQDANWYGGWPRPRRHCARLGAQLPHGKGHSLFMRFSPYFYFRFGRRR